MNINWFTVIAQIVNFLILVWLLKRFLYKPVLKAIDEREKRIASQLEDAAAKKTEADKEHEVFQQKNEVFDKERAEKMSKVYEEATSEKQRLFEEVRKESTALRTKYETALKQQEQEITDKIKRKTKDAVFAIAGKALADLADVKLEEQAVSIFIKKIHNLDDGKTAKLKKAFDTNKKITVKSAFELSAVSKSKLEKAIGEISERKTELQYIPNPELVSGIEIDAVSYQLSWNIDVYLDSLKKSSITKEKENASV